jgi:hypothetical protein
MKQEVQRWPTARRSEMRFGRIAVFTAVLLLLGLVFGTVCPIAQAATTGTAHCSYRLHQNSRLIPGANDLHFTIYTKYGTTINDAQIEVDTDPPPESVGIVIAQDHKSADVTINWSSVIPYCSYVQVDVNVVLDGYFCNNNQGIKDVVWTYVAEVADCDLPDHEWVVFPRETLGPWDYHKFVIRNADSADFDLRGLVFHWGYEGLVDSNLYNFTGWDSSLYELGDTLLFALGDSVWGYLELPAQGEDLIHIHGHYELWSGGGGGDSLLGECWFHHYDFEALAVDMADLKAAPDADGNIEVTWTTLAETDNAGFAVYRSLSPDRGMTKVSERLIAPRGSALGGATYVFADSRVKPGHTYYYWVKDIDIYGHGKLHGPVSARAAGRPVRPVRFSLAQNNPNPFRAGTEIEFGLPDASQVTLAIYNPQGQVVKTLVEGTRPAGYHVAVWDGTNAAGHEVSAGVYYCELRAGSYVQMRKMAYVK